jgi:hypothetical protein
MRLFSFFIAALTLLSGVIAVDIQKSVLITYPPETPDSVVNQAKKAIVDAGGMITHEYTLIKYAATLGILLLLLHGILTAVGGLRLRSARRSLIPYRHGARITRFSLRRTRRSTSWEAAACEGRCPLGETARAGFRRTRLRATKRLHDDE